MRKNDPSPAAEISKSELKREAREMFVLGRRLTELAPATLRGLPLNAELLEAVEFARSIKSRVARKRQLGYLARLLRLADTGPVEAALERLQGAAREVNARHHRTKAWRDALAEGGDATLAELVAQRADADRQALRQLMRNARREAELGKPPAAARKLFKALRELDESQPLPNPPT